jgi:hypothetical protein
MELLTDPDQARSQRAMAAVLQMKKIDIAALKTAAGCRARAARRFAPRLSGPPSPFTSPARTARP